MIHDWGFFSTGPGTVNNIPLHGGNLVCVDLYVRWSSIYRFSHVFVTARRMTHLAGFPGKRQVIMFTPHHDRGDLGWSCRKIPRKEDLVRLAMLSFRVGKLALVERLPIGTHLTKICLTLQVFCPTENGASQAILARCSCLCGKDYRARMSLEFQYQMDFEDQLVFLLKLWWLLLLLRVSHFQNSAHEIWLHPF